MHRFIVGTGRCGSTLLSKMIGCNPEVASVFEFFNGQDGRRRFQPEPMSGPEYRALVCKPEPFLNMVLQRRYPVPEVTYPLDDPSSRFGREDPLPWILGTTIPRLSDDPDAFFEATCRFLESQPDQPPVQHALDLFAWWGKRTGRSVWVERSGAAIDYLGALDEHFEDARFLHIHRQGEEAALSMREHHAFRLAIMLANRLPAGTGRSADELRAAAPGDDHIRQLLESRPPAEPFGRWWNDQVSRGMAARKNLDDERYREIRFEDLLERPGEVLEEVAGFLALPDPAGGWRNVAAGLVRAAPQLRLPHLEPSERESLSAACAPGNAELGRREPIDSSSHRAR